MNSTTRFSNRIDNYVRYRPDYPSEVIELMRTEMNLDRNSVVADIGSGTGIFARQILASGCAALYGVEPNAEMRAAGEQFLADFPAFQSISGTAENTNLPAESANIITAAQAFHWFDIDLTKAEFSRILRADGYVTLIWNQRRLDGDEFSADYGRFLTEQGDDYEKIRKSHAQETIIKEFFNDDFTVKSYSNSQTLDYEGFKGRVLSSSYMPAEQDDKFPAMIAALQRIFARHQRSGKITIFYDTKVFYKRFK